MPVDVDAVQPSALEHCRHRFKVRHQCSVGPDHRKGLAHEYGDVEWTLRQFKTVDLASIEPQGTRSLSLRIPCCDRRRTIERRVRLSASGSDHGPRLIDSYRFDSAACEDLSVRRVATRDIDHPLHAARIMPTPDLT